MPSKKDRSLQNVPQYEAIKKAMLAKGVPLQEAKTRAAMISNGVTPGHTVKRKK